MQAVARYNTLPFVDESFALVIAEWAHHDARKPHCAVEALIPIGGLLAISYPGVVNRDAPASSVRLNCAWRSRWRH